MQQLNVIEHLDKRVLTTPQIAEAFGTNAKVINRNFQRNNDHYEQGVHYFALTGEALKQFKGSRQNDASLKFVSVLYLWTERGAWLHAKSLNNDRAWQAYNTLIESYYQVRKQMGEPQTLSISYEQFQQIERRVEALEQVAKNITLHSGEQTAVRKAVGARVYELTKDNGGARQVLFRSLYAALKERYRVGSYRDLKQYQLQDALRFIAKWGGTL